MEDRHTFVINPDKLAPENYAFMLRDKNVTLIQEQFSQAHVKLIQDRLNKA